MPSGHGTRVLDVRGALDSPAVQAALAEAAAVLRAGGLVAFPTETVYGLGADATNAAAVAGIFAAKQRPFSDPLIVHIANSEALSTCAQQIPETAWLLAERFWPGPLTLIVPRGDAIPTQVTAGGATVGVRVPAHPVARALLRLAGVPVAAPSANRFMHTSPTTAAHVLDDLDGRIDCVLDGGPCAVGVESTVLDLLAQPPRILRPGGVTLEALRALLPTLQGPSAEHDVATAVLADGGAEPTGAPLAAPGQFERHYAPHTRLLVYDAQGTAALTALRSAAQEALSRGARVGALLTTEDAAALADLPLSVAPLGTSADVAGLARAIYAALRALDEQSLDLLLAHTVSDAGLGLALNDRLRRAAGGVFQRADEAEG